MERMLPGWAGLGRGRFGSEYASDESECSVYEVQKEYYCRIFFISNIFHFLFINKKQTEEEIRAK